MKKNRGYLAVLVVVGAWAAFTAYFAYLHTFTIRTWYLDERIALNDRQYIIQEVDAVNFERVFPDDLNDWPWDVIEKLPVSLRRPFWELVNFYTRPQVAYSNTWEVNIKGVAIPSLGPSSENPDIYIDGHYNGRAVQQPNNEDYSFFNTRGKYYSAEEVDQPITLIFEDKSSGDKTEVKLVPQWEKQYYFMSSPADMAEDPADSAHRFFALASQGKKQEALQYVVPENRNELPWPPSAEIWNQMKQEDGLNYSLERQENRSQGVIYVLTVQGINGNESLAINLVKKQNHYEIRDFR